MNKISTSFAVLIIALVAVFITVLIFIGDISFSENGKQAEVNRPKRQKEIASYPNDTSPLEMKKVIIENGETRLSFEIPENWVSETRNSGEQEMNDDDIRSFLGTNINSKGQNFSDMTDEELSRLTAEDLRREIKDFPNATVAKKSEGGGIDYSDWNPYQVDFNFTNSEAANDLKEGIREDARNFLANNPYQHTFKWIWSMENVGGYEAETVTFPLGLDSAGQKNATVELTGGKIYFISLGDSGKTMLIKKQGRGDETFEKDFNRMIDSLEFEVIDAEKN